MFGVMGSLPLDTAGHVTMITTVHTVHTIVLCVR